MDENPYQTPQAPLRDLPPSNVPPWVSKLCMSVMIGGGILTFVILVSMSYRPDLAPPLRILGGINFFATVIALATLWIISRRG